MKEISARKIVICTLAFVICALLLLVFCTDIAGISTVYTLVVEEFWDILNIPGEPNLKSSTSPTMKNDYKIGDTPWDIMQLNSVFFNSTTTIFFLVFGIIVLLLSIVGMVLTIIGVFVFSYQGTAKCASILVLIADVLALVYAVSGIVLAIVLKLDMTKLFPAVYDFSKLKGYFSVYTNAYIPLIFVGICSVAYFICIHVVSDKPISNVLETKKESTGKERVQDYDVLIKYKELLDRGIVSKEEFENKKRKILR